jgi:predicted ATPase
LEFLKHLPDDAERARQELSVLLVLGLSLGAVKGWAATELEPVYGRARELCAQVRDPDLSFRALYGQWIVRWWKRELDKAMELADELLATAEDVRDPAMLLCGNFARGTILLHLGEWGSANEHQERAQAVFDLQQPLPAHLELRRITSFGYLCIGLFANGYPDRAWAKSRELLEVAQRSSDPYVLIAASCFEADHDLTRGNSAAAQKRAEQAMDLTEEAGFKSLWPFAAIVNGAALIAQGRYAEGIAGMRRSLSAFRASGATPSTGYLCFLALGLANIGRSEEGLQVLEEGFASVAKTGERSGSPHLHHVKGEIVLAQNPSDGAEAERCYRTAIEIARRQKARIAELRASTSLARLLAKHGRRDEAHAMLADIYGWFTEGFDTRDLKDAKALLDELET